MSKSKGRRRDIIGGRRRDAPPVVTVPQQYDGFQVWTDVDDEGREVAAQIIPDGADPGLSAIHGQLVENLADDLPEATLDEVRRILERLDFVTRLRDRTLELLPFYVGHVLSTEGEPHVLTLLPDVEPDVEEGGAERVGQALDTLIERLAAWAVSDGPARMFDDPGVRTDMLETSTRSVAANVTAELVMMGAKATNRAVGLGRPSASLEGRILADLARVWADDGARLSLRHAATTVDMRGRHLAHRIARDVALDAELVRTLWAEIVPPPAKPRRRRPGATATVPATASAVAVPMSTLPEPLPLAGFVDGYGAVPSDQVTAGLWAALAGAADRVGWRPGPTGRPYFPHKGATYSLEEEAFATVAEAFEEVDRLGDREADVFDAVCAAWSRNAEGPSDFVTLPLDETLSRLGYLKHQKGGHRREHRDELRARLVRLSKLRVNSPPFTRWEDEIGPGGKRRRVERTYRVEDEPVLFLGGALAQIDLEGASHRAAVRVRPGETVARALSGPVGQQFAYMSEKLLALDGRNAIYPKRIGRYFHRLWRIRATKGTHDEGVMVRTILEGASIQITDPNRGRFRKRIEEAFETLEAQGITGPHRYRDGAPSTEGRWFDDWLEAKVCVEPPPALREAYRQLEGERRARSTRRALPAPPTGGD